MKIFSPNHVELPAFTTIEQKLPLWLTAREIVTPLIPPRATFSQFSLYLRPRSEEEIRAQQRQKELERRSGQLLLNTDWLQRILDLTPHEDEMTMVSIFEQMNQALGDHLGSWQIEEILNFPITSTTMVRLSSMIRGTDLDCERKGSVPTSLQVIEHMLGIKEYGMRMETYFVGSTMNSFKYLA
jgi:hypothetical protein